MSTGVLRRVLYVAEARALGGRDGTVRLTDGSLELQLNRPPALGGKSTTPGADPEQLFALGFAGCFHGSIYANAERIGLDATGSIVMARVSIGTLEGEGGLGLAVELHVDLPAVPPESREALAAAAHASCPYARAVRGNIVLTVSTDST